MKGIPLLCLIGILVLRAAPAAPPEDRSPTLALLAERAETAYEEDRYEEARDLYRVLAESGGDGAQVRHNLGNCHLRLGDLGAAILEYRRALIHDPALKETEHNLEIARGLLPSRKAAWQPPPWEVFLRSIPRKMLEWATLFLVWAGNLCLILVLFLAPGNARKRLVAASAGLLALAGIGSGLLYFSVQVLPARQPVVVLRDTPVYPNPSRETEPLDRLPGGTEAIRITKAGDWSLVLWGEGRGWTASADVEAPSSAAP